MPDTFRCTLVTPEKQVMDQDVVYASIPAFDGQLGVAPQRAPLLAKLGDGTLRVDLAVGESLWFYLGGGFAQMKGNHLTLLTEQALPAEEIAANQAEAALREALAQEALGEEAVAAKARAVRRARAMLALAQRRPVAT